MMQAFGRFVLAITGWRIEGALPELPKFIIIGAPHSSNWDFIFGMSAAFALRLRVTILAKHTLFRGPLAPIMRWCGVIPVNRSASHGVVGECVQALVGADKMIVAITPEGTRTPGPTWKSGFWRIARAANVPVVPIALDFGCRAVRIGAPMMMTDDVDADAARLSDFYVGVRGARRTIERPIAMRDPIRMAD